jgi:hypothetical protein
MIAALRYEGQVLEGQRNGAIRRATALRRLLEEHSLSANPTVVTPSDEFLAPPIRADGINVAATRVILRGKEDSRTTPRPQGEVLAEPAAGLASGERLWCHLSG